MCRLHDTFEIENIRTEVNCYNDIGGTMSSYSIGDKVPESKQNSDFEDIAYYGTSYNIFNVSTGMIVIIRKETFISIMHYTELREVDVNGYLCIDINGDQIEDMNTVADYKMIAHYQEKRQEYLSGFSMFNNKASKPGLNRKGIISIIKNKISQ